MNNAEQSSNRKKISIGETDSGRASAKNIAIRATPNSYFIALFLLTFYAAFLIYVQYDAASVVMLFAAWIVLPVCAFSDRIVFDGRKLIRTGFIPRFWSLVGGKRNYLRLRDVEQVETRALRTMKRDGKVAYRYSTSFHGKDTKITFASGDDYQKMIEKILPLLPENVLDNCSLELRDYLTEPKKVLQKAESARIPPAEILEKSFSKHSKDNREAESIDMREIEKADDLRTLGNQLRLAGYLVQALEAFRRALEIKPRDGWLIYEFARCLYSFAVSERNSDLQRKAFAALRLAEKRADGNSDLLERLGETYFQYGDLRQARKVFQKVLGKTGESFRAVRGLAEISLREGKIAHVIHHLLAAGSLAETTALRRWSRNEAEYFTRLNNDEEYMEMEVSRLNLLGSLERSMTTCLRIALFGIPLIIIGMVTEENLIANFGWAVSSIGLIFWILLIIGRNVFSSRIPLDMIEEE